MDLPIALITGAGTGLGKELALELSKTYHVVLVGRRQKPIIQLAEQINHSGSATELPFDVTDEEQIRSAVKKLKELSLWPVDLVVNNAGVGHFGSVDAMEPKEWQDMFQVNTFAPMLLTRAFVPEMKKRKRGIFLNILSTAALRGKVNESGYAASKFALKGFSESLSLELEPDGIRVIRAYMGGMNTPFWEQSDHVKDPTRFRTPKEVAQIIIEKMKTEDEIVIESKK
ncbi:SDR family NAD(P)-dependent oxidoreductase [Jeotgalibacillus proteolyticus]|uniref:Short-chain dehydrogenase n=1 Tax=Jeotgalibacillus proteolyticus TaxID=2082395 RepID=A0A2S5G775_9BACL|nr:SDR family oxidoreductase [Jeotgalibacillus proteolyticus]PPA68837.1 short-chain dehydrogenase [Jeotgalibacillus proteolyticus]